MGQLAVQRETLSQKIFIQRWSLGPGRDGERQDWARRVSSPSVRVDHRHWAADIYQLGHPWFPDPVAAIAVGYVEQGPVRAREPRQFQFLNQERSSWI
jgi:hypothetical protein